MAQIPANTQSAHNEPQFFPDFETADPMLSKQVRVWLLTGLMAVLVGFIGFGSWAAVAPIAKAVIAVGLVKVDSNRKRVQHEQGGVVSEILIKDGDRVLKGQALLKLDQTHAKASLGIVQSRLALRQAELARLTAERDKAEAISFPDELVEKQDEKEIHEVLDGQRRIFASRAESLKGRVAILEKQIEQLRQQSNGVRAQQVASQQQLKIVSAELKDAQGLLEKGFVKKPQITTLEREVARLGGEIGEFKADNAGLQRAVSEKKQAILQTENDHYGAIVDELKAVQEDYLNLKERYDAASYVLDHVEVRSPASGVIVDLSVYSSGQVIGPGETLLEIVPDNEALVVEAKVNTMDVDNLALGQTADLRFGGLDQNKVPVLHGQVEYVSADILTDESTGAAYYQARISVGAEQLARMDGVDLQPGMPVEVIIKTGERTVLQYLTKPIASAMSKAWKED